MMIYSAVNRSRAILASFLSRKSEHSHWTRFKSKAPSNQLFTKDFAQAAQDRFLVLRLAFPDGSDLPSQCFKTLQGLLISGDVSIELFLPELDSRLGSRGLLAAWVTVPKTSMYEYNYTVPLEYEIWRRG